MPDTLNPSDGGQNQPPISPPEPTQTEGTVGATTPVVETPPATSSSRFFFRFGLLILGILALLASFHVGTLVGFRKASFSCQWNQNYGAFFGGPPRNQMPSPPFMKRLPDPHGAFGKVLRIDDQQIIVKDRNGYEKNIFVPRSSATIRKGMDTIRFEDIRADDTVSVFGRPDADGRVEADLIRIIQP